MKTSLLATAALLAALTFSSCKKDAPDPNPATDPKIGNTLYELPINGN